MYVCVYVCSLWYVELFYLCTSLQVDYYDQGTALYKIGA